MIESDEDFGLAYETYAGPIYQFFYWRTQDHALAEDLTSSVFERAWRSRASFTTGSLRAWLYRIARNRLIDHWRSRPAIALGDTELVDEYDMSAELDRALVAECLHRALERLPLDMRLVINLRFIEGLPSRRVARLTGLSESNVRVIQYRALKKLRGYLDE